MIFLSCHCYGSVTSSGTLYTTEHERRIFSSWDRHDEVVFSQPKLRLAKAFKTQLLHTILILKLPQQLKHQEEKVASRKTSKNGCCRIMHWVRLSNYRLCSHGYCQRHWSGFTSHHRRNCQPIRYYHLLFDLWSWRRSTTRRRKTYDEYYLVTSRWRVASTLLYKATSLFVPYETNSVGGVVWWMWWCLDWIQKLSVTRMWCFFCFRTWCCCLVDFLYDTPASGSHEFPYCFCCHWHEALRVYFYSTTMILNSYSAAIRGQWVRNNWDLRQDQAFFTRIFPCIHK